MYGTPTMFTDLLEAARAASPDLARYSYTVLKKYHDIELHCSLRNGIMAGSSCPAELCRAVVTELNMPDFVVAYGMTETSPVTFQVFLRSALQIKNGWDCIIAE